MVKARPIYIDKTVLFSHYNKKIQTKVNNWHNDMVTWPKSVREKIKNKKWKTRTQ